MLTLVDSDPCKPLQAGCATSTAALPSHNKEAACMPPGMTPAVQLDLMRQELLKVCDAMARGCAPNGSTTFSFLLLVVWLGVSSLASRGKKVVGNMTVGHRALASAAWLGVLHAQLHRKELLEDKPKSLCQVVRLLDLPWTSSSSSLHPIPPLSLISRARGCLIDDDAPLPPLLPCGPSWQITLTPGLSTPFVRLPCVLGNSAAARPHRALPNASLTPNPSGVSGCSVVFGANRTSTGGQFDPRCDQGKVTCGGFSRARARVACQPFEASGTQSPARVGGRGCRGRR